MSLSPLGGWGPLLGEEASLCGKDGQFWQESDSFDRKDGKDGTDRTDKSDEERPKVTKSNILD